MIGGKNKERDVDVSVQFTVAKLAAASLLEIFKVILTSQTLVGNLVVPMEPVSFCFFLENSFSFLSFFAVAICDF